MTVYAALMHTQQNIHRSVTGCERQHPVTDLCTGRKIHVAYRLYIWICAAVIKYKYGTDLYVIRVSNRCVVIFTSVYCVVKKQVWQWHFIHVCDRCVMYHVYTSCTHRSVEWCKMYCTLIWYVSVYNRYLFNMLHTDCSLQVCGDFPLNYTDWL